MFLRAGILGGLRAVGRSWGLLGLLLAVSLVLSGVLAIPLSGALESSLEHRDAASTMMYGFDYEWWSQWSSLQAGFLKSFGPALFDRGFVLHNWNLALRGELPGGLFRRGETELDGVIAGVAILYLLAQVFLAGGILAVFRAPQGHWGVRSLLHGSGFYFGRLARIGLIALACDGVLFALNGPFARLVDRHAAEVPSEAVALLWIAGRVLLLASALVFVSMVACYARVIVVLEERTSALLAFVSAASFCLGRLGRTLGHYAAILLAGVALLLVWSLGDRMFAATGYKSQFVVFLWGQGLIVGRLALRLGLWGGQMEIYRRSTTPVS